LAQEKDDSSNEHFQSSMISYEKQHITLYNLYSFWVKQNGKRH